MIYYKDKKFSFVELFNEENGFLIRSNIYVNGIESNIPADRRAFPELIDIGIMGSCHAAMVGICKKSGIDCYQSAANKNMPNMHIEDYKLLLGQCIGKTFQVALGGAGDPNKHESFQEVLEFTREMKIVPNLTTSGHNLLNSEVDLMKKHCGAVAVSFYSRLDKSLNESNPHTISAVNSLVDAGCKVNIHYVLSNDTLDEAIIRINECIFPKGIMAIVFILYKPVGAGKKEKMINAQNKKYIEFLETIHSKQRTYKIGFDTCQSPGLLRFNQDLSTESIDACEAARFSMYIDCDMKAYPCSFGFGQKEYSVDLNHAKIEEAWASRQFDLFRMRQETMCNACSISGCMGCALDIGVDMCGLLG